VVRSVLRPTPAESWRYGSLTLRTSCSWLSRNVEAIASSSRWFEPWISQYSSCTLRFHHVLGHGVFSSHGPQVAIAGASFRAAEANL
jgi:hypothetical protein